MKLYDSLKLQSTSILLILFDVVYHYEDYVLPVV